MLFLQFFLNLLIVKQTADFILIEFEQFIHRFDRPYRSDSQEYWKRIQIFEDSLRRINYLNSIRTHPESAVYGITKYTDLSPEEFRRLVLKRQSSARTRKSKRGVSRLNEFENDIPPKFDWRDRNVVNAVHNQGECGACWAHSTAATIESMVAIKTGNLVEFSVQQLIDCSSDRGCEGGDTRSALVWMTTRNVSLETAHDYPSKDFKDQCHMDPSKPGVKIRQNYTCDSFVGRESRVVEMIAKHGPLIAAVDASTWQHYLGGIIQYHCFNDLNHAVQITGYDLTGPIPYYKIRNTWDVNFGIDGYVHVAIGANLCGIAEEVSAIDVGDVPESLFRSSRR